MVSSKPGRTHKADKRKRRSERNSEDHRLESLRLQVREKMQEHSSSKNRAA